MEKRQKQRRGKGYFNSLQLLGFSNHRLGLKKWKTASHIGYVGQGLAGVVLRGQDFGTLPFFEMPCTGQGKPTAVANNPNISDLTQ